jgi:hypothetical protein
MFSSFFNRLDYKAPHTYKNADLSQGKDFKKYEHAVKTYTFERLPFLELTSMPGLTSINEAFNGDDSIIAQKKHISENLSQSETDFNKTLSEYSTLQQNLATSALYHTAEPSVNENIMAQLARLNKTLLNHAKKISAEMGQMHVEDTAAKQNIQQKQAQLNTYIEKLEAQRAGMDTVDGIAENAALIRQSNHYFYLMWFIVVLTFLALFMYILTSDLVMNTLLVIICLMVIYLLARTINNTYM